MLPGLLALRLTVAPPTPIPLPPDPLELELVWRAPSGCPTQPDLERRLRELLPGDPTGDGVLHVEGDVTVDASGAHLTLASTFRGVTERREITSTSCDELGEATAVWLAVALEPSASARRTDAPPQPSPILVTPPPRDRTEVAPPEPDPTPSVDALADPPRTTSTPAAASPVASTRRPRIPALGLRIAAGLELGALPPPAGAVQLAALLLWRRARLEVHGTYLAPRTRRDASGQGARLQLGAAGVRGCGRLFARTVEFPLCLGAEAGAVRARALGLGDTVTIGPWAAAIASAGVARAWGPVAVHFAVEGLGRLVGTRFLVGDVLASQQFPVSARALLGIELRPSWGPGARK